MSKKGMMVILSAPSGCGKDTVFHEISSIRDDVCESISATTRQPRDGEADGVNYFFISTDKFEEMIEKMNFLNMPAITAVITERLQNMLLIWLTAEKSAFLLLSARVLRRL